MAAQPLSRPRALVVRACAGTRAASAPPLPVSLAPVPIPRGTDPIAIRTKRLPSFLVRSGHSPRSASLVETMSAMPVAKTRDGAVSSVTASPGAGRCLAPSRAYHLPTDALTDRLGGFDVPSIGSALYGVRAQTMLISSGRHRSHRFFHPSASVEHPALTCSRCTLAVDDLYSEIGCPKVQSHAHSYRTLSGPYISAGPSASHCASGISFGSRPLRQPNCTPLPTPKLRSLISRQRSASAPPVAGARQHHLAPRSLLPRWLTHHIGLDGRWAWSPA